MRCTICGTETNNNDDKCLQCRQNELHMRVLTPEEKQHFSGVTIDAEPTGEKQEQNAYQDYEHNARQRIYIKQVGFGSKMGFFTKLFLLAILAFFVFIALPVAIVLMVVISLVWFVFKRK